jgi:von Willebrand factor type A domain
MSTQTRYGVRQLVGRVALRLPAPGTALAVVPAPLQRPPRQPARPIVLPPLAGRPSQEIERLVRRATVLFLMDDSGSMYSHWGDERGVRYAAALSLVELMRRAGGGRAGVVHWGSAAPPELVTPPVDVRRDRRELRRALTIPIPTLGGNDLPAALDRAAELLSPGSEDDRAFAFVIGDGIEAVTPEVHRAVAMLPQRAVHMLLVDRSGGCDAEMERAWQSVAFGSFTRLDVFDTTAMAYQLANSFAACLGLDPLSAVSPTNPRSPR